MSTPVVRFAPDSLPTSGEVRVSTEPTATRFYGLDWLRAGAAVAVVGLHAAMPYMLHPFPGLHWTTHDPQPSAIVDACGWALNACVMPVFFLMSGFFAARTFTQKSVNDALQHRARRIVFPLIFGCLCILPLSFYVWVLSWVCDGLVPVDKLRKLNIKGPLSENLWGVAHLWYLEYLFLFTVVAWTALRTRVVSWGENHTRLNWSVVWQLS